MVVPNTSKAVLQAILDAYPDEGVVVGVNMERGWGDILRVELVTKPDPVFGRSADPSARSALRSAVSGALAGLRNEVRVLTK